MSERPGGENAAVTLYGVAGSAEGYEIRDYLSRTLVPFEWVRLNNEAECVERLGLSNLGELRFPIIDIVGQARLFAPDLKTVAACLGRITLPRYREYDVSIYGAGPAGLSAAVYAASEGLRTVLIERHAAGGQAGTSSMIENYLGFPDGTSGAGLAERARQQAVKFGAELVMMSEGVKAHFDDDGIHVQLADGESLMAKSNICATGVEYRRLGIADEARYLGRGLFYGAGAAEAPYCSNEHVFVVGAGNSAGQAVMHFANYASRVTMLVRGSRLSATLSQYLVERIEARDNVEVIYDTEVSALHGSSGRESPKLEGLTLRNRNDGTERRHPASRLFVCIGGEPNTDWAQGTSIVRDASHYLVTGPDLLVDGQPPASWPLARQPFYLETSVPGSFAAGDVRHGSIKRVASAVGEGAMAVSFVHRYLEAHH